MKYLKRIIKAITAIFLIATAVMLVFIFITHGGENLDMPATLGRIIVVTYMIILFTTVLSMIIAVLIGIVVYLKRKGARRLIRSILISFAGGVVMFVAVSLIKYRTFFSLDVIYIPIAWALIPAFSFFLWNDEN